jgi:2-polyprenyl-6-methoxyphenol hydroxylase-like FAD-dependent oxidoreductase
MSKPEKIVIVGGGTAGWMAANLMVQRWADQGIEISLLESPDIGIIGVGEGSTPQLKAFLDKIGAQESDWMPRCNATFKVGISFVDWSTRPGFGRYFHPFPAQPDRDNYRAFVYHCFLRRQSLDVDAHPDRFFLPAYLAANQLGPKAAHSFPFEVLYGYHFDSALLGTYLRDVAVERGVRHIEGKVTEVVQADNGDIASLNLDDGGELEADFFVDSTGFRSLLLQQALDVSFDSFDKNLFNDSAVVMPTPQGEEYNSQTISTAMKCGWAWDIPLTNRVGNGYVYSSKYCSAGEAETELREKLGLLDDDVEARHLQMRVGQVRKHWHRNCIAVGLSQGFIEPLEATALHIVQETIEAFMANYEEGNFTNAYEDRFNDVVRQRFEGVRDYIVCHYRANSRDDTDYWRDNAVNENLSDSLKGLLSTWLERGDLSEEIGRQDISRYYNTISWHCLLAGYGVFPDKHSLKPPPEDQQAHDLDRIDDFVRRCALNFAKHSEQLSELGSASRDKPRATANSTQPSR